MNLFVGFVICCFVFCFSFMLGMIYQYRKQTEWSSYIEVKCQKIADQIKRMEASKLQASEVADVKSELRALTDMVVPK